MSNDTTRRRSRRLADQPPSRTPELAPPRRRRRIEPSAPPASFSHRDTSSTDVGSEFIPPTEEESASLPQVPPPPGPRLRARAALRDVHIFDNQTPPVEIGGLHITRGISNQLLYDMTRILIGEDIPVDSWRLQDQAHQRVPQDNNPVLPGNYYIISSGEQIFEIPEQGAGDTHRIYLVPIRVIEEDALTRTVSKLPMSTRHQAFNDAVRQRDQGCVITKVLNDPEDTQEGIWDSFQAAHVSPWSTRESGTCWDLIATSPSPVWLETISTQFKMAFSCVITCTPFSTLTHSRFQ